MSGDEAPNPPPVLWAQRSSAILLTICVEDCKDPEIKINPDNLYFSGIGSGNRALQITINLYKEIDPEKSFHAVRDRNIEFILKKKEEGPFWPQLTKEKVKHHWLRVDFNKWRDEDDSEDEGVGGGFNGEDDFEDMVKQMGGLKGREDPSLGDLGGSESDSDDGDLPDLE